MSGRVPRTIAVIGRFAPSLIGFRGPLLQAMVRRGHRVIGCAPMASDRVRRELAGMGVEYRDVPVDGTGLNPFHDLYSLHALRRLFADVQPDILLGYTIKPVIYGSLAARLAGVPERFSMITGVGYAFSADGPKARLARAVAGPLYRAALSCNRRVFFQNPDDLALFERLGCLRSADQAVLINGSGVDLARYAPAPLPPKPSFLMLTRLLKDKGVREYVDAARILKARRPDLVFRLAGRFDSNPMAIALDELAAWVREGILEYLGHLDDVRPALAEASVYVLPSYREGTPRSVLEAMAMGRPIVTTDAPGCRETVVDGLNGFLVPPRDPEALAAAMERFVVEPALIPRIGAESRRIAERKYDVHKVNAVILEAMGL